MTKKKLSLKEKIRRGGPTELTRVWIGAPSELIEAFEKASKELESKQRPSDSLAGDSATDEDRAKVDKLREELSDYLVEFRLRGLDSKRWERLVAKHQPRKDEEGKVDDRDKRGWNAETFPPALVRATTVTPELDDEDWIALLGDDETEGSLTPGQVDILAGVAYRLSQHAVDVPFWSAASPTTQT